MTVRGKPKLVVVDSDAATLRAIAELTGYRCDVLATVDPTRALAWLASEESVAVFMAGESVKPMGGVALLERVREERPAVERVLLTEYAELTDLVAGLHSGAIQRLVQKPVRGSDVAHGSPANEVKAGSGGPACPEPADGIPAFITAAR